MRPMRAILFALLAAPVAAQKVTLPTDTVEIRSVFDSAPPGVEALYDSVRACLGPALPDSAGDFSRLKWGLMPAGSQAMGYTLRDTILLSVELQDTMAGFYLVAIHEMLHFALGQYTDRHTGISNCQKGCHPEPPFGYCAPMSRKYDQWVWFTPPPRSGTRDGATDAPMPVIDRLWVMSFVESDPYSRPADPFPTTPAFYFITTGRRACRVSANDFYTTPRGSTWVCRDHAGWRTG